jgi:hypothetical protein
MFLIRILIAWCGVSLLVSGIWMLARVTPRHDRWGRLAAVSIALLGCGLVLWSVQAGSL